MKLLKHFGIAVLCVGMARTQSRNPQAKVALATVTQKSAARNINLPGELLPFLVVDIHAKIASYVERVFVDRGSIVKLGDKLLELSAPEIEAQIAESESKLQSAEADRVQAEAQLIADQSTYERTKQASQTPGAIAANELLLAEQKVAASKALVHSREQASAAAKASVSSLTDLQGYLHVTAPFSGVITDRLVHPGAFVGPTAPGPLLVLQQVSSLRLVVPVPEEDVGGIVAGATVRFQVPAFPSRTYSGKLARLAHSLDPKTRTMSVEVDVRNPDGTLAPGMYPNVTWPLREKNAALFVPKTSIVTTSERSFVIKDSNGKAEWIDVKKGPVDDDLLEVIGDLRAGDKVVRRATDEIRPGEPL